MRRKDREVTDLAKIAECVEACEVFRVAMIDGDKPYIVPLNYGYEMEQDGKLTFYFHCATAGRKVDILAKNNNVCFELETDTKYLPADENANWSYAYTSIIGTGACEEIVEKEGKVHALDLLMKHCGSDRRSDYGDKLLGIIKIYRIVAQEYACKHNPKR